MSNAAKAYVAETIEIMKAAVARRRADESIPERMAVAQALQASSLISAQLLSALTQLHYEYGQLFVENTDFQDAFAACKALLD